MDGENKATVRESRAFDHLYDPHFITGTSNRPLYRTIRKVEVIGADRSQFFTQPTRSYFHDVPLNIVLDPDVVQETINDTNAQSGPESKSGGYLNFREPPTKTIAIQTDYRDSEAQTDPYTPDVEIVQSSKNPGKLPDVMQLANLSYAEGTLPVGPDEVELLERAKIKEAIIASLPNSGDKKCLELRRKVLEELEKREWMYREWILKRQQKERLQKIETAIWKRDEEIQQDEDQRLDRYRVELHDNHMKFREDIQQRRIKELRKVSKSAQTWSNFKQETSHGGKQRDIIGEYSDFGSQIYAPMKRFGSVPKNAATKVIQNARKILSEFDIPVDVENRLSATLSKPVQAPLDVTAPEYSTRVGAKVLAQLDYLDSLMNVTRGPDDRRKGSRDGPLGGLPTRRSHRTKSASPVKNVSVVSPHPDSGPSNQQSGSSLHTDRSGNFDNMYKKFQPIVRPPTPRVEADVKVKEEDSAVVLLQSLIRGCVVQNAMFSGKERQLELIRELRIRDARGQTGTDGSDAAREESEREAHMDKFLANIIGGALLS